MILNSAFDGMKYGLECGIKLILAAPGPLFICGGES